MSGPFDPPLGYGLGLLLQCFLIGIACDKNDQDLANDRAAAVVVFGWPRSERHERTKRITKDRPKMQLGNWSIDDNSRFSSGSIHPRVGLGRVRLTLPNMAWALQYWKDAILNADNSIGTFFHLEIFEPHCWLITATAINLSRDVSQNFADPPSLVVKSLHVSHYSVFMR